MENNYDESLLNKCKCGHYAKDHRGFTGECLDESLCVCHRYEEKEKNINEQIKTLTFNKPQYCSKKGCNELANFHFNTGIVIIFSCKKHLEEIKLDLKKVIKERD